MLPIGYVLSDSSLVDRVICASPYDAYQNRAFHLTHKNWRERTECRLTPQEHADKFVQVKRFHCNGTLSPNWEPLWERAHVHAACCLGSREECNMHSSCCHFNATLALETEAILRDYNLSDCESNGLWYNQVDIDYTEDDIAIGPSYLTSSVTK